MLYEGGGTVCHGVHGNRAEVQKIDFYGFGDFIWPMSFVKHNKKSCYNVN